MIEGKIINLDLANRSAVILGEDGNAIPVKFAARLNVEIIEPETVGLMGGDLEDLEEGYEVEVELASKNDDGSFICDSIACIS
ncbi:MAG: hypothetical protein VX610_06830 [SAR324 cluster bacterium]|nr:hypothetical protein [SAR324 cluster bacterium]